MPLIPFNRVAVLGNEFEYLREAVTKGHISGNGPLTARCEEFLAQETGAARALLTTSCTHALEMSALLLDLGSEDEVVIPSFTFVSTANAFALRGVKIRFADIRPDTLNIDENGLEALVSPKTKAIVVVHYAGVACEMDPILEVASRFGIPVVEDNAHGLFGHYRGRPLGSMGSLATQSFHETKNFSCGEGGALLVNDARFIDRAEIIREKGTNRARFFRGQVDRYTWIDLGSSYVLSDMLAGFLLGQLEQRDRIQAHRRWVFETYSEALAEWAEKAGVRLPIVPEHCGQSYHMFYLLMPSLGARQRFIQHLSERDVLAVFHYLPLHLSAMGRRWGGETGDCPVTEDVSDRLVRLPFYNTLSEGEMSQIVEAVSSFVA